LSLAGLARGVQSSSLSGSVSLQSISRGSARVAPAVAIGKREVISIISSGQPIEGALMLVLELTATSGDVSQCHS
jgi:hypothetical protein